MTKLIVIHYDRSSIAEDVVVPPHVVLAARGDDGKFAQIGHVGGGAVSALRLIGVAAVSRPGHEIFGTDAFQPPHFFRAEDFFAAPEKFVGYHPQFIGLRDAPEDEEWIAHRVDPEIFGYGLPIAAITVQTIEDLPRGGEPTGIVEG